MTFATGLVRTYRDAWRFLAALPLLGLAIVGVEGVQHIIEWRAGMYVSGAGAHHAATDMGRMVSGSLKVLWLYVVAFWVFRFVVSGSPRLTLRAGPGAIRGYAWVMAFMVALGAISLWLPVLAPAGAQRTVSLVSLAVQLATFPLGIALTPWILGAALGDARATIGSSFRRARGSIWWGVALSLGTALPLMAIHYALGLGAVGRPELVSVSMLVADALFVGYLGVATATAQVVIAERMASRAGEALALAA
ncbi:MAG: hypothetical protein JSR98_11950 [Proteobacteria bacterium]|nr:hypothetical protein [Pseudomonadota bacterium]